MGFVIPSTPPPSGLLVKVRAYHSAPRNINKCVRFATSLGSPHSRISTGNRLRDPRRFIDTAPVIEPRQPPDAQWRQESYRPRLELGLPWRRQIKAWLQGHYSIIRTRPIPYISQYNNPKCLLAIWSKEMSPSVWLLSYRDCTQSPGSGRWRPKCDNLWTPFWVATLGPWTTH